MTDKATGADGPSTEGPPVRRSAWIVVVLVVVAAYGTALLVLGGEDAAEAARAASLVPLAGALVLTGVVTLTWPLVHQASIRAVGADLDYPRAIEVSMSAFTVSHTLPGGGALAAVAAVERMGRFGIPGPVAATSITFTGLVSLTTVCGLGVVGIALAVTTDELPGAAMAVAGVVFAGLATFVAVMLAGIRSPSVGERVIGAIGRLHHRLRDRTDAWRRSWRETTERAGAAGRFARVLLWSAVKWTADISMLALIFVAFEQTPRLTILLVAFGVAQVLAAIPATPAAVGFVEGGMLAVFAAFGMPTSTATLIVLTYRVFETWLPTLAGVPMLLRPSRT